MLNAPALRVDVEELTPIAIFFTVCTGLMMSRLSCLDPILNRVLANYDTSMPAMLRVYFILHRLGDQAVPWLLRCLVVVVLLLVLLHLNFIDNAVLVFAKLTSLVRCMIVQVSQRLPRRFLVLTDSVTFHYPPILHMRLRRLLVHHTAIAHHAIISH